MLIFDNNMNIEPEPRNRESLIELTKNGHEYEYIYFWGHRKNENGVFKSCFSQWYSLDFSVDGVMYRTAEHYMMAEKARLFDDMESLQKIIKAESPREAKAIGRTVKNFNENIWAKNRFDIVVKANLEKFEQNRATKDFLLNTSDKVLVEASPHDKIWGIGLAESNKDIEDPNNWKGKNLLGFALLTVRRSLKHK